MPVKLPGVGLTLPKCPATCKLVLMPELPDIAAYISALEPRIVGQPLERIRLNSAFLLRTAQPPLASVEGRTVRELRRIGKRIVIGVENDLWLALHLMIAGRLHWQAPGAKLSGRRSLAAFDFPNGSLVLTEAGTKHRASLHLLQGEESLRSIDPGGIDIFSSDLNSFRAALTAENHTLKRALTDPRLVSGIGNAYSDEILHAAQLSPITLTQKLEAAGVGDDYSPRPGTRSNTGLTSSAPKRRPASPKRSRRFAKGWQFMGAMASRVRDAATKFCEFVMPTKKRTIARAARRAGKFWRIAVCPGYWDRTGRERWRSWKR